MNYLDPEAEPDASTAQRTMRWMRSLSSANTGEDQPGNETGADMKTSTNQEQYKSRYKDFSQTAQALHLLGADAPYQPGSY